MGSPQPEEVQRKTYLPLARPVTVVVALPGVVMVHAAPLICVQVPDPVAAIVAVVVPEQRY